MTGSSLLAYLPLAVACASSPSPCAAMAGCPRGEECLANRCVRAGGQPVAEATERHVLEPVSMSVLGPDRPGDELPAAVTFGDQAPGPSLLLLRFAPDWSPDRRVESAFLLLESWPGVTPGAGDVPLEVWRILSAWTPGDVTWPTAPRLGHPRARGLVRSAPSAVLRVDVTAVVEELTHPGRPNHGMAIKSTAQLPFGASFATGAGGGSMPRLEVYLEPAHGRARLGQR